MNKLTKEELLERLDEIIKWFPRYQSPALQERRDEIDDVIRSLIENIDKKESREVWNKWTARIKDDYNLGPMHIIYLVKVMLEELDLKIEEKETVNV